MAVPVINDILQEDFSVKPQDFVELDWDHEDSQDLRLWCPLLPGQGSRQDNQFDKTHQAKVSSWPADIVLETDRGGILWDNDNERITIPPNTYLMPTNITLLACVNIVQSTSGYTFIVSKQKNVYSAPWTSYELALYTTADRSRVEFRFSDGIFYEAVETDNLTFTPFYGKDVWVFGTYNGTVARVGIITTQGHIVSDEVTVPGMGNIGYWASDIHIGLPDYYPNSVGSKGFENGDRLLDLSIWGHGKPNDELSDIVRRRYASLVSAYGPLPEAAVGPVVPSVSSLMFAAPF